jgi:hypothetical protein
MQDSSTPFNQWAGLASVLAIAVVAGSLAGCEPSGSQAPSSTEPASAAPSSEPVAAAPPASAPPASSAPPVLAGWVRYSETGFSIAAPAAFTPDPSHDYGALGPGKDIKGFSLTIPASLAKGTNLGGDSYIAVETLPGTSPCAAAAFLDSPTAAPSVTSHGLTYLVATGSDAGAGNFYDETVYAVKGSSPCLAVRYFVHSLNIGNFTPGAVKAFNDPALIAQFDAIRATLTLDKAP